MAKKYYWLRLKDDWFSSKVIKKLRKIAGGDTYTVIYLKMQLLSLRDEGKLYYDSIEDSFEEEIASVIDEDVENVCVTVAYLKRMGLLQEVTETEFLLPEVPSLIGNESASAERVRKYRATKKLETQSAKALHCNADVTSCNADVTSCNTEKEKREKEREEKRENSGQVYDLDSVFDLTYEHYPHYKKRSSKSASKTAWMDLLIPIPVEQRMEFAKEIYRAITVFTKGYLETHPNDEEEFMYVPAMQKWLKDGGLEDALEELKEQRDSEE